MLEFFKKWFIFLLIAAIAATGICITVGETTIFSGVTIGLLTPFFIYLARTNYMEEKERKRIAQEQLLYRKSIDEILLFVYRLVSTHSCGNDLEAPQNVNDLFAGCEPHPNRPGFDMRMRFLSTGRAPIPVEKWDQKKTVFQTDFNWGVNKGDLTGTIKVKRFFYSDNTALLDIEVIP